MIIITPHPVRDRGFVSMKTSLFLSIMVMLSACSSDERNLPLPIECSDTMTESSGVNSTSSDSEASRSSDDDTSTSTGTIEPGYCAAYLGCVDACTDEMCREDCASVTGADVAYCEMLKCDELSDACALGDVDACHRLPECAESESSSDSSSGESSSDGSESSSSSDETSNDGSGSSDSSSETSSGE